MAAICNETDASLSLTPQAHRGKRWTNFLLSLLTLFILTWSIALTRGMQVVADGSGACLCTRSEMCVEFSGCLNRHLDTEIGSVIAQPYGGHMFSVWSFSHAAHS